MKGLEQYIRKHGYHFTYKLASEALVHRWKPSIILHSSEEYVYYNVSSSTDGDIIALVTMIYHNKHYSKRRCIKEALQKVGDVRTNGLVFTIWSMMHRDFDFTEYI